MKTIHVALIGPGLVGKSFLKQLSKYNNRPLDGKSTLKIKLIGLCNSKRMVLSQESGKSLDDHEQAMNVLLTMQQQLLPESKLSMDNNSAVSIEPVDLTKFIQICCEKHHPCVVVDSTSNEQIAAMYPTWLDQNVSIVTPNKKSVSGDLSLYKQIKSKSGHENGVWPMMYHESSVGAGLPLISTIQDLVQTGDKILSIEGVLSGTLSYIFNEFSSLSSESNGKSLFSEIVQVAKSKGYTEPDPRDDLNGIDVARKVVILGRLIGLDLSLETLTVENIVPEPLRNASLTEFETKLNDYDSVFDALKEKAKSRNKVLRYVGVVDGLETSRVEMREYDASHAFSGLKGSDNVISIVTERFPNGLVIQGAGAGDEVTAFGMFSDLLKIARVI